MNEPAGIYIHVPFCAQKCPYCDFYSGRYSKDGAERYTAAVIRNIAALPEHLAADSVYFGGGTPSLLPESMLADMLDAVHKRCQLAEDAEITLEVNPLTASAEKLRAWREIGINRLSMGIQSFQPDVLRILGRRHTPEEGTDAVMRAYVAGFRNISIDLMLGLAQQSEAAWQADLDAACALPVTHISAYLLKIEPRTPFGIHPPALLDDDTSADRWMQMHSVLREHGFRHYEISNFAKTGFESRHNRKYWALIPYYGIGPAAHSCHDGKRFAVPRDLDAFCASEHQPYEITEPHAESDTERIMLGLRLADGILLDALPDSRAQLMKNAAPFIPKLLSSDGLRLSMTPEGWLVSNSLLVRLLSGL